MRSLAVALALAVLLPPALAQAGHGHDGPESRGTQLVVDVRDDVQVGDLARFNALVFGDDTVPDEHQDLHLQVLFDGRPLLETTGASGHDYDGISQFDVTFPTEGPYLARVLGDAGEVIAETTGWAVASQPQAAVARLSGPAAAEVGHLATYRVWPEDAEGNLVQHFYTLFEVYNGPSLVYRAKTHGHNAGEDGRAEIHVGFPTPGVYTLTATIFQGTPIRTHKVSYAPLRVEHVVQVVQGIPSPLTFLPLQDQEPLVPEGPLVDLSAFYDPAPVVGPTTLQHLTVLGQDSRGHLGAHVDYAGRLVGPLGQVLFETRFMHESDGVLDFATTQPAPGRYTFEVRQSYNAAIAVPYDVAPVEPEVAVPYHVDVIGLEGARSGVPQSFEILVRDLAGNPLTHSEVDLQVIGPSGAPIVMTKLHTHEDGRFPVTFTPLQEGAHSLRILPFPLDARPIVFLDQDSWSDLPFTVAAGQGWATVQQPPTTPYSPPQADVSPLVPALAALATLLTGVLAVTAIMVLRKRR